MFDAVVNIDVVKIQGVPLVIPLKELCHIPRDEVAERGSKVVDFMNDVPHLFELDVLAITRKNTVIAERVQSCKIPSLVSA